MRITFECIALVKACKICILFRIHSPVRRWSSERRSRASWVHQHLIDIYTRVLDLSCIQRDPSPLDSVYLCTRLLSSTRGNFEFHAIDCTNYSHLIVNWWFFTVIVKGERTLLHENKIDFWLRPSLASRSRNCEQCSFRLEQSANVCCVAEVKNELHLIHIFRMHAAFEIWDRIDAIFLFCDSASLWELYGLWSVSISYESMKNRQHEKKKLQKNNNKSKPRQFEQQQKKHRKVSDRRAHNELANYSFPASRFYAVVVAVVFFSVSTCFTVQESEHQWLSVIFNISFVSLPFWVVCGVAVVCRHIICIDRNFGAC